MTTRRLTERAVEAHSDALASYPNVVGIGMTDSGDDVRRDERSVAVAVYVSEKRPAAELGPDDLLPGFVEIDDQGDVVKVPVKVIEMGEVAPQPRVVDDDTDIPSNEGGDGSTFSPQ